jgi:hypothetical protein
MYKVTIFSLIFLFASLNASASDKITGTYSNLYLNDVSGDLVGIEVRIMGSYKGYYLSIQCSGDPPFIVPLQKTDSELSFVIPSEKDNFCPAGKLTLRKSENKLYLTHAEIKEFAPTIPLKKGGYWDNDKNL